MATRQQFELTTAERRKRHFSADFKMQKVREIELKQTTVAQVGKAYQVRKSSVYLWIEKYSKTYTPGFKLQMDVNVLISHD